MSAFSDSVKFIVDKMIKRINLKIRYNMIGLEYIGYDEIGLPTPMYYYECIKEFHHSGFNTNRRFKLGDIISIPRHLKKNYGSGYEDVDLKYFKKIRNPKNVKSN